MPFANEHSCRLEDPGQFDRFRRRNNAGTVNGKRIDHIIGIHDGSGSERQAIRYPLSVGWDSDTDGARQHCQSEGGSFEAAEDTEDHMGSGVRADLFGAAEQQLRQRMRQRVADRGDSGYQIRNQGDDSAVVRLYGEIHWLFGIDAEEVADKLDDITASEIEVQINSPGGGVFDAIAIFNALRSHPARVTTRVDGIAASAASVIVQAGDRRVMLSGSQQMIHEAHGLVIGPAGDMREMADLLDKQTDIITGIYAERSGRDTAGLRELVSAETWLSAQEAVDEGLADEVVIPPRQSDDDGQEPDEAAAASQDLSTVLASLDHSIARLADQLQHTETSPAAGREPEPAPNGGPDPEQAQRLVDALKINAKGATP